MGLRISIPVERDTANSKPEWELELVKGVTSIKLILDAPKREIVVDANLLRRAVEAI